MTIHDFAASLKRSHKWADAPWWTPVYRRAFPDAVSIVDLRHNGWHQRAGRDRAIVLSSGRTIYIDEKVRETDYGDVLVEIWSVYPKNGRPPYPEVSGAKPGWARELKDCDWLAYAVAPSETCYLYPFLGIRAATLKSGRLWIENANNKANGFKWCEVDNGSYYTINIAVPAWILASAVQEAMTIPWGA